MRISDSGPANPSQNVNSATPAGQNNSDVPVSTTPQDEVSISSVAQAASKAIELPESKIQELRAKYLDGTYHVDSRELSSKVIDEHLSE